MIMKIAGRVRGPYHPFYPENREDEQLNLNSHGDLVVAQGLPPLAEIARMGESWQVQSATGNTALTGIPTTAAHLSLYNGEYGVGIAAKCYVIESFGSCEEVIDAAQSNVTGLFAMMTAGTYTATGSAGLSVRSTIGRVYGGRAITVNAATVTNHGWFPHSTPGAQIASGATGANFKVNEPLGVSGLYIIPPGGAFHLAAVKATAAATAQQFYFVRWHEVPLIIKT